MARIVVLLAFLTGCVNVPDVERSFRECLIHGASPTYSVTADMRKVECRR